MINKRQHTSDAIWLRNASAHEHIKIRPLASIQRLSSETTAPSPWLSSSEQCPTYSILLVIMLLSSVRFISYLEKRLLQFFSIEAHLILSAQAYTKVCLENNTYVRPMPAHVKSREKSLINLNCSGNTITIFKTLASATTC